jgi:formylglycine-generating enzyme required for sulfatase activity
VKNWSRGERIALVSLLVSIIACLAAVAVVPEVRRLFSLEPTPTMPPTWTRPADDMVMAYVPAGEFRMGSTGEEVDAALVLCSESRDCQRDSLEDEQPAHIVALDGFWIDSMEVSNRQYRLCVEAGSCDPPSDSGSHTRDSYYGNSAYDDYPVISVDWHQAAAYCEWVGGRLPTEAEWEYAARGPEGRRYPWGDAFDGARLNYCDANCEFGWADGAFDDGYFDTAPVGSYPAGASWVGVLGMAGNVWEWVADWYDSDHYSHSPSRNPTGPLSGGGRVLRGGSWRSYQGLARCSFRDWSSPGFSLDRLGFRCISPVSSSDS